MVKKGVFAVNKVGGKFKGTALATKGSAASSAGAKRKLEPAMNAAVQPVATGNKIPKKCVCSLCGKTPQDLH
eukprot:3447646-Amphidinium_carterae.1